MGKNKKSKYVGSCGMYVFSHDGDEYRLLVHRRSKQVSESHKIAAPGGIVERIHCGEDGKNLKLGAKATAARELREESGISLSEEQCEDLIDLPAAPGGWWGDGTHFNFGYVMHIDEIPPITGPEKDSQHELIHGGLRIGEPAGDGYHAWVRLSELLQLEDLMPACRTPIEHFLTMESMEPSESATRSTGVRLTEAPALSTSLMTSPKPSARPFARPSSPMSWVDNQSVMPSFPPQRPPPRPSNYEVDEARPSKKPRGAIHRWVFGGP
ncbi:unnamed protein product [Cladocopium goreaui]|uniref:DNA repair protein REV1 n=1 Tax=Cladocopium goreaui TaxID=2562237 RepID=A0A9P1DB56_9DINO|nr:unnamed protein product [Cladocopium goreaui]